MGFARQLLAAALMALAPASGAAAADDRIIPTQSIAEPGEALPELGIDGFLIGRYPTPLLNRERAASIDGTSYSVVAPLYLGEGGGMISYLRLFNGGTSHATFTVKVVGSPTGRDYGDATFSVAPGATRQLPLFQVLQGASATITEPDTNFSFYIRSTEPLAGYQHVTHSPAATYFENSAVCRATIQEVVRASRNQMVLSSVHTSQLATAGYPASIELHNFANTAIVYRLAILDESTGLGVGTTNVTAQANASYTIPWAQIESAIGWSPTADQIRANLVVTDPSGAPPAVLLGQTIINNALQVTLNMTTMCAVNATGSDGAGSGTFALTLTKTGAGTGEVTSSLQPGINCGNTCTFAFEANRLVTLTAAAASGSTFVGWGGACSGTATVCNVTMTAAQSVTATFGTNTLTVQKIGAGSGTVTSSPTGIVCGSVCSAGYSSNATPTLTAIADTGSTFLGWSGCTSTSGTGGNICTVAMNSDKTVTATFTASILTVQKIGSGTVSSSTAGISCGSTCSVALSDGTTMTLTATPASGLNIDFLGWSGCTSTSGNNGTICSIVMSGNRTVTATFR